MLKGVGMTVPKSRKTSAVYMRKTGDEGSIYAARQGMRAYNNTNMRNPIIKDVGGVMHVIIVACPHPLSCCIYTALVFLLFGTVIPTSFNI